MHVGPNRAYKTRAALDKVRKDNSKYVERVLEIIDYFQPKEWYIELRHASSLTLSDTLLFTKVIDYPYQSIKVSMHTKVCYRFRVCPTWLKSRIPSFVRSLSTFVIQTAWIVYKNTEGTIKL